MADPLPTHSARTAAATVDSRMFGTVELFTPPLTISTALVDGIIPCSLWVLTLLLGMVMHTGSRGKLILVGAVNVKDFFAFKRGVSLTISEKNQRRIGARARDLIRTDRSNLSLVVSTILLAAGVAIVELPCTAGFPVGWSNLLSGYQAIFPGFLSLLLLYLVVYLIDEIVIVGAAALPQTRRGWWWW